jgi:hypothetical protein
LKNFTVPVGIVAPHFVAAASLLNQSYHDRRKEEKYGSDSCKAHAPHCPARRHLTRLGPDALQRSP